MPTELEDLPMPSGNRPVRRMPPRPWAPSVQVVPPVVTGTVVARPRLEARLDRATARRLTVVAGGAGAGKSTMLAVWAARRGAAWLSLTESERDLVQLATAVVAALRLRVPGLPESLAAILEQTVGPEAQGNERSRARACAGLIAGALASLLTREQILVLDDLEELGQDGPAVWLIEALCRQAPERLRIVLATREPLPFSIERLRGQGQASTMTAAALALDRGEIRQVLEQAIGPGEPELVDELERATAGWPAAVRLAAEALVDVPAGDRRDTLARLLRSSGPIYTYLAEEVVGRATPATRDLLAGVAGLPRFGIELCTAIGIPRAEETIRSLEARGLFIEPLPEAGWFTLHPLIREHLARASASDPTPGSTDDATRTRIAAAARWFESHGAYRDAVACATSGSDAATTARILEDHGAEMLMGGDVETVLRAATGLPTAWRSATIDRLEGEARQIRGDWAGALACYRRIAADGTIDAGLAWRMGLIHHLRGELDEALRTYARGSSGTGPSGPEVALLHAWTASAHWLHGNVAACRSEARQALELAEAVGDDQALAAAHTVAAMLAALDGDRRTNDVHYLRALEHAARCGDQLQTIRIRANRGSRFLEEGEYEAAIDELTAAIAQAEVAGFAAFHALALSNRGQALLRLGRLEEAVSDLERSRELYQRLDSRLVSYPLGHLGRVHAERGALALARAAYEEAIAVADGAGDVQGLQPALSGLAELLAWEEPDRAAGLAERAVAFGPGIGLVGSLVARGWVAMARGQVAAARDAALEAAAEARGRRDRAGLAEALELEAATAGEPGLRRRRLEDARVIWSDLHARVAEARTVLDLAELTRGAPQPAAPGVLREAGAARRWRASDSAAGSGRPSGDDPIRVRTFGGFGVTRDGQRVPTAAWGSRKARDLFKILLTRRGQHVPREQLRDLLWPADDPGRTGRRLSVAISTVRAVLDPEHRHDAGWYVATDRDAVWLERDHLRVDVDAFLADAAEGLARAARSSDDARPALEAAEAAYRGEYLVEDAFEDWAAGVREDCRQAYLGVAHELAAIARQGGDPDSAARYLRRILEQDEFDERAHLALVTALAGAGHPADARRAYSTYLAKMEELGVEAAPFPG